jgi:twitching motility protein PilT
MARIDDILRIAVAQKASDIHFSADCPVMMRKHGDLTPVDPKVYSSAELQEILLEIIDEKDRKRFMENKNLDKSYSVPDCGNFRLNFFWTRRGVGAVIRWLPTKMPDIDDLGLPPIVKKLCDLPKGLLLVTGPTGSGKSTTLASMINYMNTNFSYHILTVEDPVEFVHPCKKSLINQREIGQSCLTFADALKYALREDPDVILVGEMRDQETIGLALTAAETGHLVFGTLHTRGAASSVDRIIESFPATERPLIRVMLSESLRAVISQILLKSKDGKGRVACYEIMVANYAISNLIREGKTFQIQSILQTAKGEGMMQMEAHIRQLMAEGKVDPVEADAVLSSMMRANQQGGSSPAAGAAPPTAKPVAAQVQAPEYKGPKGPDGKPGPKQPMSKSPQGKKELTTEAAQRPKMPESAPVAKVQSDTKEPAVAPKPPEQKPLDNLAVEKTLEKVSDKAAAARSDEKTFIGDRVGDKTVAGITVKALQEEAGDSGLRPMSEDARPTQAAVTAPAPKVAAFVAPAGKTVAAPTVPLATVAKPPVTTATAAIPTAKPATPPVATAVRPTAPLAANPATPAAKNTTPPIPAAATKPPATMPTVPTTPAKAGAASPPPTPAGVPSTGTPPAVAMAPAPTATAAKTAAAPTLPSSVPPTANSPIKPPASPRPGPGAIPPAKPVAPSVVKAENPAPVAVSLASEEPTKTTNEGFTKKTVTLNRPVPSKKAG